jgi:hypothetical protein
MGILGGIMTPKVPAVACTAVAKGLSYPRLTIAGIRMVPIAATVATAAPEIAPKNILAIIATKASPPEKRPTIELAKSTSLLDMPPNSIREPARIKNGTAMRGKESVAVNIFCTSTMRGTDPEKKIAATDDRPIAIAMGTFIIKKRSILAKRIVVIGIHPFFLSQ